MGMVSGANDKLDLQVSQHADSHTVMIAGDLSEANAIEFARQIDALSVKPNSALTLNLHGLDIDDGVALATVVNVIRRLRARVSRLILIGAPQMLGHNLYRVGLLGDDHGIELVDMRQDEPAGF
jgi:anti-anti-sigma regulatory factor